MSERELEILFKKRQKLIDQQQRRLARKLTELEKVILNKILEKFVAELKTDGGVIASGKQEITLSEAIDKIFNEFVRNELKEITRGIGNDFKAGLALNSAYYRELGVTTKFNDVALKVRNIMKKRIGISEDGKIITDGYLDRLTKNVNLRNELKQLTYRAVTGGMELKKFQQNLKQLIVGTKTVDGSLTKYYKQYAFDTYMQFDRSTNTEFAKRLKLTDFIYSGGLIETSREFCKKRNNKMFNVDEISNWANDKDLPKTSKEKESGVTDYIPEVDLGRWNCRHMARYVSKELLEVMNRRKKKAEAA